MTVDGVVGVVRGREHERRRTPLAIDLELPVVAESETEAPVDRPIREAREPRRAGRGDEPEAEPRPVRRRHQGVGRCPVDGEAERSRREEPVATTRF